MAVKYLSGNRLWGTNAERLALTTTGNKSWKFTDGRATASHQLLPTGTTNAFTLMMWVKFFTLDSGFEGTLLRSGSADDSISMYATENGLYSATCTPSKQLAQASALSTTVWAHIAIARDGSGTDYLYLNGATAPENASGTSKTVPTIADWTIGERHDSAHPFQGNMTQILVYTDQKSLSDIQDVYNSGDGRTDTEITASYSTNLQTWYNMAQTGSTLEDQEGSNDCSTTGTITKDEDGFIASVYPNLPNGSVFITSDSNEHFMWNSSAETWHEVA